MYKLLLCWRYLRTRYIALASIISVTLGVATMIVVNSVMEGFGIEMRNRLHGIYSDIVFASTTFDGMNDAAMHEEAIRKVAGDDILATSPTVVAEAILNYSWRGAWVTRQVELIGIDERTQGQVSDFSLYLQHPENRREMSFDLRESGYDLHDHQAGAEAHERTQMADAGWQRRRQWARELKFQESLPNGAAAPRPPAAAGDPPGPADDPFRNHQPMVNCFDPAKDQHTGAVLGIAMASGRTPKGDDWFRLLPGDDVKLTFPTVGQPPKAASDNFTVVDFYESKMAEYDAKFVFVPIRKLQELRGMINPTTGVGMVNAIQIRLKPGVDGNKVRDKLRAAFDSSLYQISTWRDMQAPLLSAVETETSILNVLLFMIIAVAGFGILAIFYMIVVEKTRDIGILKSLGASGAGVMGIFLSYGLSLGIVGAGAGMVLGLLFVRYINQIAAGLGWLTGRPIFDPSIYYFYRIPAIVVPATVAWIVLGSLAIAVGASILPARRAARLQPVEALRYE
jgi:lipoprotein-releasing system permease protein